MFTYVYLCFDKIDFEEELISGALVEKMATRRNSGFSVHSKVRAQTRKEAERVGKSMIRPLLSLERLSFSEKKGKVCYRYGEGAEPDAHHCLPHRPLQTLEPIFRHFLLKLTSRPIIFYHS